MRWILLIIILGLGAYAAYEFLGDHAPDATTASGTAKMFLQAAAAGDAQAIQQLCLPGVAASAEQVAKQLRGAPGFDPKGVSFQAMEADPPREGLSGMAGGRVLSLELAPQGNGWKIALIDLASM